MPRDLPPRIAYDMPPAPADGAVHWPLDPNRAAVLVHDMQRHFVSRYDPDADPARTMIAAARGIIDTAHRTDMPVYYSAQPADQPAERRGLLTDFWGPGMTGRPEAAEIIAELRPADTDTVVTKWRYSAFELTDLERRLKQSGRDQLVICGVYANIGILTTAVAAFMRNIQPFIIADACADFTQAEHTAALGWVAQRCGRVLTTEQALAELRPARPDRR